jgi:hypothetical protein
MMNVGDEAEPRVIVAVIEDEAVVFAVGGAQPATDHLDEQHLALGRAGEDDAADIPIYAGGQAADVADDLDLAATEPALDG